MTVLKTHTRKYGDLKVEVRRPDNDRPEGPIQDVILIQPDDDAQPLLVQLTAEQAWNLVDLLAIVDPETFARRFPQEES